MRIESSYKSSGVAARGALGRSPGAGMAFQPQGEGAVQRAVSSTPAMAMGGIESLLALQAAEDPAQGRKKAVRRGQGLLDTLEDMKADLLVGQLNEGSLNRLLALMRQGREKTLPQLDAVIDDIELRVQVELAKLGRL